MAPLTSMIHMSATAFLCSVTGAVCHAKKPKTGPAVVEEMIGAADPDRMRVV